MTRSLFVFQPPTLAPVPGTSEGTDEGGKKNIDVPMIGAILAAVFILVIIILGIVFYRKKNYSCCKEKRKKGEMEKEKKRVPSLSDVRLTSTGGIVLDTGCLLSVSKTSFPSTESFYFVISFVHSLVHAKRLLFNQASTAWS